MNQDLNGSAQRGSVVRKKFKFEHWKSISLLLVIYDICAVNLAYFIALWLRFDIHFSAIPQEYLSAWVHFIPIYTVVCLGSFWFLRLYRSLWRFASITELWRVILSSVITTVFHVVGITLVFRRMPISYYLVGAMLQFALVLAIRFS